MSNAPRTMSIGGATFDLFLKTDASAIHECNERTMFAFALGGKVQIDKAVGAFGGGAHNTSVGLSRLGCDAAFSGVVGEDQWGTLILENMNREGVNIESTSVVEDETSSFSVILSAPSGERSILTHKGIDRHFQDITFDKAALTHCDAVYLNRIHEDSCEIEDDIIGIFDAAPHIHLTWNPGGSHIATGIRSAQNKALLRHTDLLLLNKEEAFLFTGEQDVKQAIRVLLGAGADIVIVSDGAHGSVASDGTAFYRCPALSCTVVDATGAGDAFGTAVTWAQLHEQDLPFSLRAGTINATSVVGAYGAQTGLLTDTQMQSLLGQTALPVTTESF